MTSKRLGTEDIFHDRMPLTPPPQGGSNSSTSAVIQNRGGARKHALALATVPPLLRPVLRAYLIGYASAVGPRLLTLILQHVSRRSKKKCQTCEEDKDKKTSFLDSALHIIRTGFEFERFPTFCAVLVGGSTFLRVRVVIQS